jgi:hypothetical protein
VVSSVRGTKWTCEARSLGVQVGGCKSVCCHVRKVDGRSGLERMSKMGLGKIMWSSFKWLLVNVSV